MCGYNNKKIWRELGEGGKYFNFAKVVVVKTVITSSTKVKSTKVKN